jgi:hypothetical protein
MKKSSLIVCTALITFSFSFFSCGNINATEKETLEITSNEPPNFKYDVDSRFIANISKEDIRKAKTIIDLIPEDAGWDNFDFKEVTIRVMPDEKNNYVKGDSKVLSFKQIQLLKTIDYSTNFIVDTYIKSKHPSSNDHYPYYITVIPEKEANYMGGKKAIINYMKEGCASTITKIEKGKLTAGKAHFTISKSGSIKNVTLESTSGYPSVDKKMLELIENMPGIWFPATNENGQKLDQELVFSFGTMGC